MVACLCLTSSGYWDGDCVHKVNVPSEPRESTLLGPVCVTTTSSMLTFLLQITPKKGIQVFAFRLCYFGKEEEWSGQMDKTKQ